MEKYTLTARRLGLTALVTPLTALSNLILLPILTKNLAITDYGVWALIVITISLLPWLATLGLPAAMTRFLAAATDKREIREDFYSMGFIVVLTSSIISGLFLLLVPQIAASLFQNNLTTALLLVPIIWISCPTIYMMQYFVTFQQIKRNSVLNVFNSVPKYGPDSIFCSFRLRSSGRRNRTLNSGARVVCGGIVSHRRADWFCYPEI